MLDELAGPAAVSAETIPGVTIILSTDFQARYVVRGRACEVAVDYTWGEPALTRR